MNSLSHLNSDGEFSSLSEQLGRLGGFKQEDIPFWIWLIENPQSPLSLPGSINLFNHDCLHILLDCGLTLEDEAFVIGFTMGNDPSTRSFHLAIYKFFASFVFPAEYRFTKEHFKFFFAGYDIGREINSNCMHKIDFNKYLDRKIVDLRKDLGIDIIKIRAIREKLNNENGSSPIKEEMEVIPISLA